MLRLAVLVLELAAIPRCIAVIRGGETILPHAGLHIRGPVKGVCEQTAGWNQTVSDRQFPSVCGHIHAPWKERVVLEILREIQGQIQPVAVLQFQHRQPLVQPVGLPLALLRPDIAEVDGVTDQFSG